MRDVGEVEVFQYICHTLHSITAEIFPLPQLWVGRMPR